jgi:hypothetical protein
MGHERLGRLPKTRKWRRIVADIALSSTSDSSAKEVIEKTVEAIDNRFRNIHLDPGIQDVFSFLLSITIVSRSESPYENLASLGIDLHGNPATPLSLAQALSTFLTREGGSTEYTELAKSAANKALANFYRQETIQADLFVSQEEPFTVWRKASDGRGFCVLAREFFSAFTTNYIKYFLDREASSAIPSLQARSLFQNNIEAHIDDVTSHSFETSKITQSFAAGWYNKNATQELPSSRKTSRFLSVALNKIRDSLVREGRF